MEILAAFSHSHFKTQLTILLTTKGELIQQCYYMASEDLEYRVQEIWTPFMVLFSVILGHSSLFTFIILKNYGQYILQTFLLCISLKKVSHTILE